MKRGKHNKIKHLIALHTILLAYSLGGYFSKTAALSDFLSLKFLVSYGMVILILGVYAVIWQQMIKKIPLTVAYANKAITIVWGMIWGKLFFKEEYTIGKIVGAGIIMGGIILFALADEKME